MHLQKLSGLPENQILGSGTALDTARLRYRSFLSTTVYLKKTSTPMYSESMEILPLYRGPTLFAGATLDEFDKIVHEDQKDLQPLDRKRFWSMFILQDQL